METAGKTEVDALLAEYTGLWEDYGIEGLDLSAVSDSLEAPSDATVLGNPRSPLLFVTDASLPEDVFGGPAGELFGKIVEAMGYRPDEIAVVRLTSSFADEDRPTALREKLSSLNAHVAVTLGPSATAALLGGNEALSALRGRFHPTEGLQVMPTFAPVHLLQNPRDKRAVWEDMKLVKAMLEGTK